MVFFALLGSGAAGMTEQQADGIAQIETAQQALRQSIETTKGLAKKTEALIQKHKEALTRDQSEG